MDLDLLQLATEFRKGILDCVQFNNDPRGMCFAVCAPLQGYLLACFGVETELVQADFGFSNHVWLRLDARRILDPTADQFPEAKLPPVYIGNLPAIYRRWMKGEAESRRGRLPQSSASERTP
jgi:hypothetical protein